MKFQRNKANPCLYCKWVGGCLILWMSWVDDCLVAGPPELIKNAKTEMTGLFECKELGEMDEYIGCKPVLLQSYKDEFELEGHGLTPRIPAEAGSVLRKGE
eukprot:491011-Ditylum_brightwellii.AAC.1